MTGVHLHLLVNHVPILGAIFAFVLLLAAVRFNQLAMQRTALALLVVVGVAAAAAKYSGEPAEDSVRAMPGVTRAAIHEHEELADKAFIAAAALGVFAAVALVRWRQAAPPVVATWTAVAGALVVSGLMAYTGLLGGQIRHTEVRPGATAADALVVEPPRVRRTDSVPP